MSKLNPLAAAWLLSAATGGVCLGQGSGGVPRQLKIDLPPDAPVAVISADWGESRTAERGSALIVDLHTSLSFRNVDARRIRGLTLLVISQEVTPGGKASVTKASLDVGPGESFAVRIDVRLLRPLARGTGPLVQLALDGVLFHDLSFYGPNRLDSRRALTAWELEAQRDRQWFQEVLRASGIEGLRKEVLRSLARQAEIPRVEMEFARSGRASAAEEQDLQFAFLRLPGAPLEVVAGMAKVAGNEARSPEVEVWNRADKPVRYFEIGWLVQDADGREFLAGALPASVDLEPGMRRRVSRSASMRFREAAGGEFRISRMTGFVSQVEFEDGSLWIPDRGALSDPRLQRALAPGSEEQRLTAIYRRGGMAALLAELKKF